MSTILTGYVTPKSFGGFSLPVPVQNKLLRSYCRENNYMYNLPLCELYLNNIFMELFATIEKATLGDHIGMCSIYMFPKDIIKYKNIHERSIKKNLTYHFMFEEKKVLSEELNNHYFMSKLRFSTANKKNNTLYNEIHKDC